MIASNEDCAIKPIRLAINGRFLGQEISGVQRYGREAIRALDELLAQTEHRSHINPTIFVPTNVRQEDWPKGLGAFDVRPIGHLSGHAWEQLELPRFSWGSVLINLTNSAPLAHPKQVVAVHDAAICAHPDDFRWKYRVWYRGLYRMLSKSSARFITVSSFAAREIERHFGISAGAITIVPNAADHMISVTARTDAIRQLGLRPREYVLAVGGQSRRKNLVLVEQALRLMPEPRPQLVVAGGMPSRPFSAQPAGLPEGCIHAGNVPDVVLKGLYQNALALIFPSRYEGFGLPPLEAMACGCPVIASQTSSLPEICGDAALYCDPDKPGTVVEAIAALSDLGVRDRLISGGHQRAKAFSWKRSAAVLLGAASRSVAAPLGAAVPFARADR